MASWTEFEAAAPDLAAAGRRLLFQYGPGLAFLATVRADGGPRLHPICPAIVDGHLCAFIIDSPKRRDLLRDGRYALHSFLPEQSDDEFMLLGRAAPIDDPARCRAVSAALGALGVTHEENDRLFAFTIERAYYAAYKGHGTAAGPPVRTRWP